MSSQQDVLLLDARKRRQFSHTGRASFGAAPDQFIAVRILQSPYFSNRMDMFRHLAHHKSSPRVMRLKTMPATVIKSRTIALLIVLLAVGSGNLIAQSPLQKN